MASRFQIEKAFERVLTKASVPNVAIAVENKEKTYPIVVVEQSGESVSNPRLQADVDVRIEVLSIVSEASFVDKTHYDLVEKVKTIVSRRGGLYRRLNKNGLFVLYVYGTTDEGLEVLEEEGGAIARSTLSISISVV